MNPSLAGILAPWLAAGVVDVYMAIGFWPRPRWWQFLFEGVLIVLAGRAQWKLARGWLRTPMLAAGVMAVFALANHTPRPLPQLVPFLLGAVIAIAWLVRFSSGRLRSPALGAIAAALVVVVAHHLDTVRSGQAQLAPLQATLRDLTWPLRLHPVVTSAAAGPPIVVMSVDTLRADVARDMQTVRRLGARGAVWERAMSTSNWTLPALASLQTGRMPSEHGAGCFAGGHCQGMWPDVRRVAEDLRAAGYATAAVVTNPWVTAGTGFDRGFDTFVESGNTATRLLVGGTPAGPYRQDTQHVVDAALEWLGRAPARGFYLWIHVVDPHMPYRHAADPDMQALTSERLRTSLPADEDQARMIRDGYRGEVAYVDRQLLRLVDALEQRGVLDAGVVVFTADHGEEFWEHEGIEHGHSHHREVVDVPLVLVAPGLAPGPRTGVASLVDVASTIRASAGLPPDGIDLRSGVPSGRIATAWGGVVMHVDCSARDEHRRAIVRDCSAASGGTRVFDLEQDPDERRPLPAQAGDRVASAAETVIAPKVGEAAHVNRDALRALGYQQ